MNPGFTFLSQYSGFIFKSILDHIFKDILVGVKVPGEGKEGLLTELSRNFLELLVITI